MVFSGVLDAWFKSFNYRVIADVNGTIYDGILGKTSEHAYMVVTEDNPVYLIKSNSILSIEVKRGKNRAHGDGVIIITIDERRDETPGGMKYDF